jgi:hypothetical protein
VTATERSETLAVVLTLLEAMVGALIAALRLRANLVLETRISPP